MRIANQDQRRSKRIECSIVSKAVDKSKKCETSELLKTHMALMI